jgi:predicted permease
LKEQSRSVAGDRRLGLRNTLVIVQVALSLALVVAAGLFVRTFSSLAAVPLGFNPRPLLAVALNVQHSDVAPEQRIALYTRLRESAQSVPGVKHAVISVIRPLSGGGWNGPVRIPGSTLSGRQRMTWRNAITPGWFETFGIHIVEGRDVTDADAKGAQPVAVVNQLFVNRFFPGQRLIGREIAMEGPGSTPGPSFRVVGIVTDAVYRQIREGATPTMYMPLAQSTQASSPSATLTIDAQPGPREALERALTDQLSRVDAGTSFALNWYADLVRTPLTQERVVAVLSVFFGGLALLLSGLGLYGLTSYSVTRRRREIGVRMALGANPREVVRLILTRTAGLVLSGLVAGVGLSWWASKYIAASILYGLQPRDPATVAAAAAILVSVAILASWLPARRASRVDPTTVLREE